MRRGYTPIFDLARKQMIAVDPSGKQGDRLVEWMRENSLSYDQVVSDLIPIWKKHMTLEQVQELNKFYSTPVMREMVRDMPYVTAEFGPILQQHMVDMQERLMKAMLSGELFVGDDGSSIEEEDTGSGLSVE